MGRAAGAADAASVAASCASVMRFSSRPRRKRAILSPSNSDLSHATCATRTERGSGRGSASSLEESGISRNVVPLSTTPELNMITLLCCGSESEGNPSGPLPSSTRALSPPLEGAIFGASDVSRAPVLRSRTATADPSSASHRAMDVPGMTSTPPSLPKSRFMLSKSGSSHADAAGSRGRRPKSQMATLPSVLGHSRGPRMGANSVVNDGPRDGAPREPSARDEALIVTAWYCPPTSQKR
mmetsp:Transcript_54012/g.105636  ORF Transcript_54012/g.105636 Transcript_54012/m.105636 type:complete len:240 (-) Transcript_54012:392-1111(-)